MPTLAPVSGPITLVEFDTSQSLSGVTVAQLLGTVRSRQLLIDLATSWTKHDQDRTIRYLQTDISKSVFVIAFCNSVKANLVAQNIPVDSVVVTSLTDNSNGGVDIKYKVDLVLTAVATASTDSLVKMSISALETSSSNGALIATLMSDPSIPPSLTTVIATAKLSVPVVQVIVGFPSASPTPPPDSPSSSSVSVNVIVAAVIGGFVGSTLLMSVIVYGNYRYNLSNTYIYPI